MITMSNTMTIKIGEGVKSGWRGTVGQLTADISKLKKTTTLNQIAKQLAKQMKIKHGEIELGIEFVWREKNA